MSEPDTTRPEQGPPPIPFSFGPGTLSQEQEAAVLEGAAVANRHCGVIAVVGQGSVACVQGVMTNDIDAHGDRGLVYGALLTPKGMILTDLWAARAPDRLLVLTPANGRETALQVFRRYFPPRLARTADRTEEQLVVEVLGPHGLDAAERAGASPPNPGGTATATIAGADCTLCRPAAAAPFALLIVSERDATEAVRAHLAEAGAVPVPSAAADLARVIAGWPLLGAEIGEKTLPQEVRFDELDGVSYTKGCYTGQETVARVHFRGHANRWLAGLVWRDAPQPGNANVLAKGKVVGRVTSAVWSNAWKLWLGLGVMRRQIEPGMPVTAAGEPAQVVRLPIPKP